MVVSRHQQPGEGRQGKIRIKPTMKIAIEEYEDSQPYFNFINSIKSPDTKLTYKKSLLQFINYCRLPSASSLKTALTAEELRDKIIRFFLENKNFSRNTQRVRLATIKHFCDMNDIVLNWKMIGKFVHSDVPKLADRGYSHDEIKQVVDYSDHRIKACFLFLASTGVRAGALRELKIRHLQSMEADSLYKVTVYPGTPEEYFTFTTPESRTALDRYLDFRKRNGEQITADTYLFVQQYNRTGLQRIQAKPYKKDSLEHVLQHWLINAGVREVDPLANRFKRKEVPRLHGFRKFFTTQLVHSKVLPEVREMLLGHKIGLASAYYKPTEQEMLDEYLKAVDLLTIDPANRYKRQVEKLEIEKSQIDQLAMKMRRLEQKFGL